MQDAFFAGHRSAAVPFVINDPVEIVAGPHAGRHGAVISIEAVAPELHLRVELDDGHDAVVVAHQVRLMEDAG